MSSEKRISYATIVAATQGDSEAMQKILRHYDRLIAHYSRRLVFDEYGNCYEMVDPEIKSRIQSKLMHQILFDYDPARLPEGGNLGGGPAVKETKYTEVHTTAQDGRQLALAYFVLAESGPDGLRHYGAKIEERNSGEMAQITDLTTEASRVYTLVDKLAKNSVTPTGLADVVADWL